MEDAVIQSVTQLSDSAKPQSFGAGLGASGENLIGLPTQASVEVPVVNLAFFEGVLIPVFHSIQCSRFGRGS